ncbi:hypothetical protein D3C78_1037190 [compost metagenome]
MGHGSLPADVEDQAPARPARHPQPRRGALRRPRDPPEEPQAAAGRRRDRRQVHRVRLLRAGVPVQRPDPDSAPAHRHLARHPGEEARRHRHHGAGARLPLPRPRHLRRHRPVRPALSGGDQHRGSGAQAARPGSRACRRRRLAGRPLRRRAEGHPPDPGRRRHRAQAARRTAPGRAQRRAAPPVRRTPAAVDGGDAAAGAPALAGRAAANG